MFPLHYQKATASINIITASLSMISFTTANSTTLAPLNVTTTSGSSLSSTFSPTSSNSAIGLSPFESYIKNSHLDKDSFIVCVTSEKSGKTPNVSTTLVCRFNYILNVYFFLSAQIAIAHLKVSLLSNFETKERAISEISSLVSTNILKMYTKCYSEKKSTTCIIHTFVSNQCHLSHSFRDSCSRDVLAVP